MFELDAYWVQAFGFLSAGLCMGLAAIGSGLGQGFTAFQAVLGIARQPGVSSVMLRTMLIGQAVAETSAIFALVIAILMISTKPVPGEDVFIRMMVFLGAAIAVGVAGLGVGNGVGYTASRACAGLARCPSKGQMITSMMLLGQAITEVPVIFGLVVAFILLYTKFSGGFDKAISLVSAGLSIGIGAWGIGIGDGLAAGAACYSAAKREDLRSRIITTMLTGQGVAETACVFALVVALIMIYLV